MKNSNVLTADDYGYFGKGLTGYAHYKQAFDSSKRSGGGGGGGGGGNGCFLQAAVIVGILLIIGWIANCASS